MNEAPQNVVPHIDAMAKLEIAAIYQMVCEGEIPLAAFALAALLDNAHVINANFHEAEPLENP